VDERKFKGVALADRVEVAAGDGIAVKLDLPAVIGGGEAVVAEKAQYTALERGRVGLGLVADLLAVGLELAVHRVEGIAYGEVGVEVSAPVARVPADDEFLVGDAGLDADMVFECVLRAAVGHLEDDATAVHVAVVTLHPMMRSRMRRSMASGGGTLWKAISSEMSMIFPLYFWLGGQRRRAGAGRPG
jgi:hypothetical protein